MNWVEPDDEMRAEWAAWKEDAARTDDIRALAERFDPWTMYRLTTTGQRCRVVSFYESGTIGIYAEHETLGPITGVKVMGVDPDELVPWDGEERPLWRVEQFNNGASFSID